MSISRDFQKADPKGSRKNKSPSSDANPSRLAALRSLRRLVQKLDVKPGRLASQHHTHSPTKAPALDSTLEDQETGKPRRQSHRRQQHRTRSRRPT